MKYIHAIVVAACIAASAGSTRAAFFHEVVADNGVRQSIINFIPSIVDLGPLYTSHGGPAVIETPDSITFDFTSGLSSAFTASANGTTIQSQSVDGHLVLFVRFDEPTSISATVHAAGISTITGDGVAIVYGGLLVIEAISLVGPESHNIFWNESLAAGSHSWSVSAATEPFSGAYTDYLITLDTVLMAEGGSAFLAMKSIQLQIFPLERRVIPEPASLSLLGVGAVALLYRRRRD